MRIRTWLFVVLIVFAAAPSQAQTPAPSHGQRPAPSSVVKRLLVLVPRLLGDHLSPPHPTSATQTPKRCPCG